MQCNSTQSIKLSLNSLIHLRQVSFFYKKDFPGRSLGELAAVCCCGLCICRFEGFSLSLLFSPCSLNPGNRKGALAIGGKEGRSRGVRCNHRYSPFCLHAKPDLVFYSKSFSVSKFDSFYLSC